jgi:ABC-2 type transport system ATP-binding protein
MNIELKVSKLEKTYPKGDKVLKGIDLTVKKGDFFALIGPNGAGKTTLVRILTNLITKDSGEFIIGNMNKENNFSGIHKYIGVVSQENQLDPTETVENLFFFQGRLFDMSKEKSQQRTNELIKIFKLEKERGKKANTLSGGNKRRLHCALALVHEPNILFLDEPTVGMDPLVRENFWRIITELNHQKDITIFLTTQYLDEVDKYANEMALLIDGEIHYSGSVASFKENLNDTTNVSVEKQYLDYIKQLSYEEAIICENSK